MTALSFVWVHPYSQISGCDKDMKIQSMLFEETVKTDKLRCNSHHCPPV